MPLLSIKLTKELIKEASELNMSISINLKNIKVNGTNRGCSGHIINKNNNCCVYVNTEGSTYEPLVGKSMCRYARDEHDWSSISLANGNNRWYKTEEIAKNIIFMLTDDVPRSIGECRL